MTRVIHQAESLLLHSSLFKRLYLLAKDGDRAAVVGADEVRSSVRPLLSARRVFFRTWLCRAYTGLEPQVIALWARPAPDSTPDAACHSGRVQTITETAGCSGSRPQWKIWRS
jgi:hypothetical protein